MKICCDRSFNTFSITGKSSMLAGHLYDTHTCQKVSYWVQQSSKLAVRSEQTLTIVTFFNPVATGPTVLLGT